ncbi:nitrogenase cofactor biosynthesis protein NifB [Desulfuribacillus alkaliarsenatis]|uniref:FeMo cofactor biosynthesis protein NifB n=1 Tax=Desulfuribacillus alkaliarsenatis TaxID=766136 RepID=A0A1E5G0A9_9FIRM|nr:nitrogenase cofactor biosynthesis protein NifB [Desulfuribacillus alkaliarsenatis]OEF96266.1 nitrogenase cofactor biosynthesis protein NifB [Desulfuribacillus alkaliarsenatis]
MACKTSMSACGGFSKQAMEQAKMHPCYSEDAHHTFARMHLPVAPKCNISCNYCNRKYDCMNESRPGVTSEVLKPEQALAKFIKVKEAIKQLTVVGIAGPGDALANWEQTKSTIALIKQHSDDVIFCLSTNGLMLPRYADEIVELGVNHVTITINALDPIIGSEIYKHVVYDGVAYEGKHAAEILIFNQLQGLEMLTKKGVMVKVNIVMIRDVNDKHIPEVVKKVKSLGAFMTNIMPLIPAKGSAFEAYTQTSMKDIKEMRAICELDINQMHHCKQCRADAIGLLGQDRSIEFRECETNNDNKLVSSTPFNSKYRVAVASKSGKIVDQHFGHATEFLIYEIKADAHQLLEKRSVGKYCNGNEQCQDDKRQQIIAMLADCDAVLSLRIGHSAEQKLLEQGIRSYQHYETIDTSLEYVAKCLA